MIAGHEDDRIIIFFLRWMKIQADINLDLALTNTTISTQEVQGAFPVDE